MKLYKNVALSDVESILYSGILSMDESKNNNWEGNRSKNATNVVYLFNPITEENSFIQYGRVLLEVEIDRATKNEMHLNDANIGKYDEYICDRVNPDEITKVIIPNVFKEIVNFTDDRIVFCDVSVDVFDDIECSEETDRYGLPVWQKTIYRKIDNAEFENLVTKYGISREYMRGEDDNNEIIDFYNVVYKF